MRRKHPRSDRKQIAHERIDILFREAQRFFSWEPSYSNQCVLHATRIATKERIRIPSHLRRRYCRECKSYLIPGYTGRVRIYRGRVILTCLSCGWHRRFPIETRKRKP